MYGSLRTDMDAAFETQAQLEEDRHAVRGENRQQFSGFRFLVGVAALAFVCCRFRTAHDVPVSWGTYKILDVKFRYARSSEGVVVETG